MFFSFPGTASHNISWAPLKIRFSDRTPAAIVCFRWCAVVFCLRFRCFRVVLRDLGARLLWLGREFAHLGIPAHIISDIQEADFCPRPPETDTADHCAAHGIDVEREDVFHPCPDGGSAVIQRLARGTEEMVAIPCIVDVILIAVGF